MYIFSCLMGSLLYIIDPFFCKLEKAYAIVPDVID